MRRPLRPWPCLLMLAAVCSVPSTQEPDFVVYSRSDSSLYHVDGDSGETTWLSTVDGVADGVELFRKPGAGCLGLLDRGTNSIHAGCGCELSLDDVVLLDHDVPNSPRGMDFHPNGTLYGVFSGPELRTVDPQTGATAFVALITGANFVEGIAFAPDGTCYAVADGDLVLRLDVQTGALTLIAQVPAFDLDCLTYAADGFLYSTFGTLGVPDLYRIDPADGAFTNLGSIGVQQAHGIQALPSGSNPSAAIHALIGCGVNPVGSLTVLSGQPSLGSTIVLGVHNPLGTQTFGSTTLLALSLAPDSGAAAGGCGTLAAGWSMLGFGSAGEFLLDPAKLAALVSGSPWAGAPAPVSVVVPDNCSLVGTSVYVQGAVVDSLLGAVAPVGLTQGLELRIGL